MAAVAALLVLLGVVLVQIYRVGPGEGGRIERFTYTETKAYRALAIGLQMAEPANVRPGVSQGATPLAASASPAWSLLMAGLFRLSGPSEQPATGAHMMTLAPLVINLAGAALLIMLAGHLVSRSVRTAFWMFILLVALGVLIPLPRLVMTGMEHVTHMLIILLAVHVGLRSVEHDAVSIKLTSLAVLLALVNVALRYESLGVVFALFAWAWIQHHSGRKVWSVLAGLGVVAAVGAYLAAHGGTIVPNPVLVHAGMILHGDWSHWPSRLLDHARHNLGNAVVLWFLLLIAAALLGTDRVRANSLHPFDRRRAGWLFVFVFAGLAHLLFGQTDDSYRHTAYLVPLGAVAVVLTLAARYHEGRYRLAPAPSEPGSLLDAGRGPQQLVPARSEVLPCFRGNVLIPVLCILPLLLAAVPVLYAFASASPAAQDAYVRDRVSASFVRTYFPNGTVVTNQPGMLDYETSARVFDLSGRTDLGLAEARFFGKYDAELLARQVAEAESQVALLLGDSEPVPIPPSWNLIGGWYRGGTDRMSASAVRVYSVSPALQSDLKIALRLFSEQQREGIEYWFAEPDSTLASGPGGTQQNEGGSLGERWQPSPAR